MFGKTAIVTSAAIIVCAGILPSYAQDGYFTKTQGSIWEAETLYIGAQIRANGADDLVVVMKKGHPRVEGKLYLMNTDKKDSAIYVNSNKPVAYGDSVNLGRYEKNEELVFMYVITDTTGYYAPLRGKKLYSGRNMGSVDRYTSEADGMYGKKFGAVGRINKSTVELGFDGSGMGTFLDAVCRIKGAYLIR